jgi:hypothetical protein
MWCCYQSRCVYVQCSGVIVVSAAVAQHIVLSTDKIATLAYICCGNCDYLTVWLLLLQSDARQHITI